MVYYIYTAFVRKLSRLAEIQTESFRQGKVRSTKKVLLKSVPNLIVPEKSLRFLGTVKNEKIIASQLSSP